MNSLNESIVESVTGTSVDIYPFIPYLLQDFFELGTPSKGIIDIFEKHINNPSDVHVLDLGCGKGAISIKLAHRFKCNVFGIDGIPEFIEEAKSKAKEYDVNDLCEFRLGDIRDEIKTLNSFDVIILASIGEIFGDYYNTLKSLSPLLNEDSYIIICDAYDDSSNLLLSKKEILNQISKAKFNVIDEIINDYDIFLKRNEKEYKFIEKRANELINKYLNKKALFKNYLNSQKEEYENLENFTSIDFILSKEIG